MTNDFLAATSPRRRQFLHRSLGFGALALLDALRPRWAGAMAVSRPALHQDADPAALTFDLNIRAHPFDIAGGTGRVVSANNSVPGPLLEWQEGRPVVLRVHNELDVATSIHWHGILLPFEMDGVPGVTFRGIDAGSTFTYHFAVEQSGTYWYHSHSGLQEQSGLYGPLVIQPREGQAFGYERDYVVLLSDWTFEDPHQVMTNLRKMSDYYNYQQFSLTELYGTAEQTPAAALRQKLDWDRMRMMATDIADVTGATYSYLVNGMHPAANWTGLFAPGERVRLRFINASAMTFFNVRIPGLAMTVIAADGQAVEPVETDEFQFGAAETYDVIVTPRDAPAYTIMAESIDRSGFAAGTLATQLGMRAALPPLRKRPVLSMVDMGMDMQEHADMGGPVDTPTAPSDHAAHAGHDMHMEMGARAATPMARGGQRTHAGHAMAMDMGGGPVVARHGPDHHGPGNVSVATVQRNRLGERGTGLADAQHRVLVYTELKRAADDFDDRPPRRELELHLTGHMERYMWSFDGQRFHEVDAPIEFEHGERLRLILVNDTMMNHPIHLHGMWMELENGQGRRLPRKHTINIMPASRVTALINADAPGRWAFHCHLLYHMEMGMFRVVRVS